MRIIVLGADGYLGWPLTLHLLSRGHQVIGGDNYSRRRRVREVGGRTATIIADPYDRVHLIKSLDPGFAFRFIDLDWESEVNYFFKKWQPDACIHLAEIPSAPYSMIDAEHTKITFNNNVGGTLNVLRAIHENCPDCHLIKLGTLGEYGTPNIDIPEGYFEIEYRGRKDILPFPKQPGSFYHASKVADTINIQFACKIWGLKSTDIHQGVVHGIETPEMLLNNKLITRFDYDEIFGTVINRFIAQAIINHQLTPYGTGGQRRGFIALRDSVQCMRLAIENPPDEGEYRTLNQFDEVYSVMELAEHVVEAARSFDIDATIWKIPNPRVEAEDHYYKPDHDNLKKMGFKPEHTLDQEIEITFRRLIPLRERIDEKRDRVMPTVKWRE